MIDIDFTSGFQAIQNKGVHYRFAFANLKNENAPQIQLAAANIIRKFTETDPGGYSATFIRDGLSGEIYAVLQQIDAPYNQTRIIEFPEGKEHFLRQFPDWVVIEQEDADKFNLNFTDNIGGWLPQNWAVITECFKNPQRPKSKKSVPVVWSFRNHVLKFHRESGIFTLFNVIPGATDGMNLIACCRFTQNEIFKNPAEQ